MNSKVSVLGLSKSGIASAKLLKKMGYDVFLTENYIHQKIFPSI
mgnify:CR=1 FL=1